MSHTLSQPGFGPAFGKTPMRAWATGAGSTLGMAAGFGSMALIAVFIPALEAEFGWTKSELSFGYGIAAAGMAGGGLFWGRMSDRLDIRVLLAVGALFQVISLVILSVAGTLWQFYAANLLFGLFGFSCVYAPLLAAPGEWFGRNRGLAVGVVTAGGTMGQGVMPFVADGLIGQHGWRAAYLMLALGMTVIQVVIVLAVRHPVTGRIARSTEAVARGSGEWLTPRIGVLAAAAFFCCACMGIPLVHLAGYVGATCGSAASGATTLLIAMTAGTVGRICFGLLVDRTGSLPSYLLAAFMQAGTLILFPAFGPGLSLFVLSGIFGFGFSGNMTCLILCVRDESGADRFGAAIGAIMLVAWIGMGVGGMLGGRLVDFTGAYHAAFFAASGSGVLSMSLIALLMAQRRAMGALT